MNTALISSLGNRTPLSSKSCLVQNSNRLSFSSVIASPEADICVNVTSTLLINHCIVTPQLLNLIDTAKSLKVVVLGGSDTSQALSFALESKNRHLNYSVTSVDDNPAFKALWNHQAIYLGLKEAELLSRKYGVVLADKSKDVGFGSLLSSLSDSYLWIAKWMNELTLNKQNIFGEFVPYTLEGKFKIKHENSELVEYMRKQEVATDKETYVYAISDVVGYLTKKQIETLFQAIDKRHPKGKVYIVFGVNHDRLSFNEAEHAFLPRLLKQYGFKNMNAPVKIASLSVGNHLLWEREQG